jgi:prevent-host-death family protein
MTTITSLDLRNNLQQYLLAANSGQEFIVTLRGKPVASISSQNKTNAKNSKPKPKSGAAFLEQLKNTKPIIFRNAESQKLYNMTAQETKEYIRSEKANKYGYE